MIEVGAILAPFAARPRLSPRSLETYGLFECSGLASFSYHLLVVGVGPVDRVPEQRYKPRSRDDPRHSLRHLGGRYVFCGGLSGDGPPAVLPARLREARAVPLDPLVE